MLTVVRVNPQQCRIERRLDIGIGEDYIRRLAAEFEHHWRQVACSRGHDRPSGARTAGKRDPVDVGMACQGRAGDRSASVDQIDDAFRYAGLVE